jgi:hypothetical protein
VDLVPVLVFCVLGPFVASCSWTLSVFRFGWRIREERGGDAILASRFTFPFVFFSFFCVLPLCSFMLDHGVLKFKVLGFTVCFVLFFPTEYKNDHIFIPRATSVIARRLPPSRPGRGNAQYYMAEHVGAAGHGHSSVPGLSTATATSSSTSAGAAAGPSSRPGWRSGGPMSRRFDNVQPRPATLVTCLFLLGLLPSCMNTF